MRKEAGLLGRIWALLPAVLVWLAADAAAGITVQKFTGTARSEAGQIEYVERHQITYQDDKVVSSRTEYFDPRNQLIGRLDSDYSAGYQYGSYDFHDIRGSRKNGAKVEDGVVRVYRQEDAMGELRTKEIPKSPNQIVGQGFHHFILNNLESIAAGNILHVQMVLPAELDQFKFRIRKLDMDGDTITIRLEIDNWFLRLFAPHIDTGYHLPSKRLLRYRGISNMTDASGIYRAVDIVYDYSE